MALGRGEVYGLLEPVHLLRRQVFGDVPGQMGRLKQFRRVDVEIAVDDQVMVERPHTAEDARLALDPDATLVEPSGKLLQVVKFHVEGRELSLGEVAEQQVDVVAISVKGIGRVASLQFQVTDVAAHKLAQCGLARSLIAQFCRRIALPFIHFRLPLHQRVCRRRGVSVATRRLSAHLSRQN